MKEILFKFLCLMSAFLLNCSDGSVDDTGQEILYDVVEHEWTIGGENSDFEEEFLLSFPFGIAVKDNGDIIVADDNRLKVFDAAGNGKLIVGNPGEGPGEFDRTLFFAQLTLNFSGELTINRIERFYTYSPTYEYIEDGGKRPNQMQIRFLEKLNLSTYRFDARRMVVLNKNEKIYSSLIRNSNNREDLNTTDYLIYETSDTLLVIKKANGTGYIKEATILIPTVLGRIIFAQLPGSKIIYTHSGHDFESHNGRSSYILKVISLDTFEEGTINHTWDKFEIDYESEINTIKNNISPGIMDEQNLERKNIVIDYLREKKFYPPVQKILYDNGVIFVFTYYLNETGEVFTDIFDSESLQYLRSAYFPGFAAKAFDFADHSTIKNGYLYYLKSGREVFAEIQKYRLDPALYKK